MYSIQNLLQFEHYNGVPLAGGKVYVYRQGRTELADIFSDMNGATPIANPAILDDLGMQEIYVSQRYNYTVVITDPYGNEMFSRDIYTPINSISGSGLPYEGIYPINVDNTAYSISADTIPFGIQEPLYFVKDDAEGMVIGMSGEFIPQSASGQFVPTSVMDLYASKNWVNDQGFITSGEFIPQSASGQFVPTSVMDLYASKNWVNDQGFITSIPESATWNTVTGKLDTTAFDNYSADISGQIDYVSANAGTTYSAGANIDITNDVISGKDWTDSITGASAYAYSEATAQIPTDYATTAQLADKLDTAVYATDSGTFLTALPADVVYTADIQDMATTGQVAEKLDTTAFSTVSANFLTAHQSLPQSADWDSAASTVSNNSASWTSAADELAVLNTAKWEGAADTLSSHSATWNSVNDKLDSSIYASDSGTFLTALPGSANWNNAYFEILANSATWNDVSAKLNITAYSTTSGNFLTAVPANYATTAWVTSQGYLTAETDWTNTITDASAYAYSEATAQIPTDYATTAQLADKLDSSIYANDSGTFLTAHQSLPESADWNSAASTVSAGYVNWEASYATLTANSANWDSTYTTVSNNSASWTGGAGGDVYTSGFEYTTGGNISAYSGSAFVGNEPTFNLVQGYGISMTTASDSLTIANTLVLETGSI